LWPHACLQRGNKRLDTDMAKLISDGLALYEQELAEVRTNARPQDQMQPCAAALLLHVGSARVHAC